MTDAFGTQLPLTAQQRAWVAEAVPMAERQRLQFLRQTRAYYLADDLRSVALVALHEGARSYDPARGASFSTYVWRRVDGALSDALKQESKHWQAARDDAYDAAEVMDDVGDVLSDTDSQTADRLDSMADAYAASLVLGLLGRAMRAEGEEAARIREGHAPLFDAANAALSSIADEEERRALTAHYVEGTEWSRVAAELGCSEKTAKRRGAAAAKSFAEALRAIRKAM